MVWTTPRTWLYKEKPGYTTFNTHIRDNLNYLKDLFHITTGHNHSGGTDDGAPIAQAGLDAGLYVPIAGIIAYWSDGGALPTNWEICDGTAVTTVGSSLIGLTKPNLVSKFVRGVANSNLQSTPVSGGADTHTLSVSEMPTHGHGVTDPGHAHSVANVEIKANLNYTGSGENPLNARAGYYDPGTTSSTTGISINNSGSSSAHNNIPAYIGLVYLVRVK